MNKISLNMIIGQRKEQFLKYALLSTKWADEHIIINTGDDNNPNMKVVRKFIPEANIIKFEGDFNFAQARNLALNNSSGQWILWVDADEVHFDGFENLVRNIVETTRADGIRFAFYHFLLDLFHWQSIDPRIILFKKHGKQWHGAVHEHIEPFEIVLDNEYRYHHYGYTKPQKEIYENWRLYWKLNPPENWKLNEYRNPNDVISDRVSVAKDYQGEYPEVIKSYIEKQKPIVKDFQFKEQQK